MEGGEPVRLTDIVTFNPVWSPAGDRIAYYDGNVGGATFPLRSVTPAKTELTTPDVGYRGEFEGYRFMPNGKSIVVVQGQFRAMDFVLVDLATGARRQLTKLRPGYTIRNFDISPDGKEILFDRLQENSDIAIIDRH